jgi:hypothetical protein
LAEPTVASRSFPDATPTVRIIASYARKIFGCGLKLSGSHWQATGNSPLRKVVKAKIVFIPVFARAYSYQKRYVWIHERRQVKAL